MRLLSVITIFLLLLAISCKQTSSPRSDTKETQEPLPVKTDYTTWEIYPLGGPYAFPERGIKSGAENLLLTIQDDSLLIVGEKWYKAERIFSIKKQTVSVTDLAEKIGEENFHRVIFYGRKQGFELKQQESISCIRITGTVGGEYAITPEEFTFPGKYIIEVDDQLCLLYKEKVVVWSKSGEAKKKEKKERVEPDILLLWEYDIEKDGSCRLDCITDEWLQVYKDEYECKLIKGDFEIEEYCDDACIGGDVKVIRAYSGTRFLIHHPGLKEMTIDTIPDIQEQIGPGEEFAFTMNGEKYTLRAEGFTWGKPDSFGVIPGRIYGVSYHTLFLHTGSTDKEEILLLEPSFGDTIAKILFIADIDGDGKPDFVFQACPEYSILRYVVVLSSEAEENQPIRKIHEESQVAAC
ncbi:MAG: hypothetical protein LIP01_12695 [Tannerellaceae bacterium]|nr:hypothetical protein [Tannerellaceae bacterium]